MTDREEPDNDVIDLAATDIIDAAKDYFALFPGLREFKVTISDDGIVTLDDGIRMLTEAAD